MFKKVFIFIIITLFFTPCLSIARDCNQIIRVGISDNYFRELSYQVIEITATKSFDIIDQETGNSSTNIPANTIIKISYNNDVFLVFKNKTKILEVKNGPIVIKTQSDGRLLIPGLKRLGKQATYRGIFEITKSSKEKNAFLVINVLDLQNYLKGVVPNEMPVRFGLEALKAQTVAARNYALKPRTRYYEEFDVFDSVASQVYFGAGTEKELSNKAIIETDGLLATYKGDLILALYSSTAGGYTENYENVFSETATKNFPSTSIPYLKAKPDNKKTKDLSKDKDARKFYLSYPKTFDNKSRFFRWERQWTLSELEEVLKNNLIKKSKSGFINPSLKDKKDFGNLEDIKVIKRGSSGKIITMCVETDKNIFTISKELVIRRLITKNGRALPSANFVIDKISNPDNTKYGFIFHGGGYGHGVGISQFGAGEMSAQGYKFNEILQHYYTGISVTTQPINIDKNKNNCSQNFFTTNKNTWLHIDNPDNIHSIIAIINNEKYIIQTVDQKELRINLKDQIKIGENKISYQIPEDEQDNKTAKVYVEVYEAIDE